MISTELLRQYPFFGLLEATQLREIAMISDEILFAEGEKIFDKGSAANALYFLLEGAVSLYYTRENSYSEELSKGIPVGEINPGEPFSISALIRPHILTSTAWSSRPSRAIKVDAVALRELFKEDPQLAYTLTLKVAQSAIERLHATRVQLAAAWA